MRSPATPRNNNASVLAIKKLATAAGIAAGSLLALLLVLALPGLAGAFGFALPSFRALGLCLLLALCTLLLLTLLKQWLGRKAEGGRTRLPRSVAGAARGG